MNAPKKPATKRRANSRRKGIHFEKLIARALRVIWPGAKRALQARSGGEVCDIEATPYHVECKSHQKVGIFRWWEKAVSDRAAAGDDREIALVVTENGTSQALVCVTLEEFVRLQREATGRKRREAVTPGVVLFFDGGRQIGVADTRGGSSGAWFARVRRVDIDCDYSETVVNPKREDGLWPTLDAAEAAVRKAASDGE